MNLDGMGGEVDLTKLPAEEIVKLLSKQPTLRYEVGKLIGHRLVSPWQESMSMSRYFRWEGLDKDNLLACIWHQPSLSYWRWFVRTKVSVLKEESGGQPSMEDAFAECDKRLKAAGFLLAGRDYSLSVLERLGEISLEEEDENFTPS